MPHSVAADEGVHGGLHKPRTHIRNEIDAVHTAALGGHQIPSTAGQQAHQHPVDDHTLLPEGGSSARIRLPEWSRSSTRITGRRKEWMVRIWLSSGA